MKNFIIILIATLFTSITSFEQSSQTSLSRAINKSVQQSIENIFDDELQLVVLDLSELDNMFDNHGDPAYKVYREAYNLILDEQWKKALKQFEEIIAKYPKSEYLDDAAYWHAYALRYLDREKAIEEYKKFLKKFTKSSYYDDAVADLNELQPNIVVLTRGDSVSVITKATKNGYAYPIAPTRRQAEITMRRAERVMRKHIRAWKGSGTSPAFAPDATFKNEELDKETELRVEALYAIGEAKEDQKSFQTLKEVALDRKQHPRLRAAALYVLNDFKKYDVVTIYLDIAKHDTSSELHNLAVDYLTEHIKDKNRSVETLIELYHAIPKNRSEQREMIFYSIAEVGNEKAIDFLAKVAKSDSDYEMRREAIYYLGSIGNEKARTVLYEILRGK